MPYPALKVTFVDPAGTNFVAGTPAGATAVDHAAQHTSHNDVVEAIEDTLGTNAGTSVLKHYAAGEFAVRHTGVAATGTLVQTLVGGTFANTTLIGTPQITGGSISNPALIGTPQITGGTVTSSILNSNTIGSPTVTSGTTTSAMFNSGTLGTPTVLGSLQLRDSGIISQIGTADHITISAGISSLVRTSGVFLDGLTTRYSVRTITQYGWNYITPNGSQGIGTFTFPVAFGTGWSPVVVGGAYGFKDGSDPATQADYTDLSGDTTVEHSECGPLNGSQGIFVIRSNANLTGGGTLTAGRRYLYNWIATGTMLT